MKIRQIEAGERPTVSLPVQAYAFESSPAAGEMAQRMRDFQRYTDENVTLVAEEDGVAVAAASAIPMRQNVRGRVYPMAGVASVASLPLGRRRGHVRALMTDLLGRMREEGCAVSALYPFRPSFYERFGYVGLPKARTVISSRLLPESGLKPAEAERTAFSGKSDGSALAPVTAASATSPSGCWRSATGSRCCPSPGPCSGATPTITGWLPRGTAAKCWPR